MKVPWKFCVVLTLAINILIALLMLASLDTECDCSNYEQKHASYVRFINQKHGLEVHNFNISNINLPETIAILIREFEFFENDIPNTINSITNILPGVKIYIISDGIPYPPLQMGYYGEHIQIINIKPSLSKPSGYKSPFNVIDRDHIFIFPDSVTLKSSSEILKLLEYHFLNPYVIVTAPIEGEKLQCFSLNVSLRYWTMKFKKQDQNYKCNALNGTHIILAAKTLLLQLEFPFSRPFFTSLYIQATLQKVETHIMKEISFKRGKYLYSDPHNKWKHDVLETDRKVKLYEDFGIKKIIYPASRVEWYGCNKNSNRCFGTVVNNMPEYLFHGRWTPPCCLENLRLTARYVFGILDKCNVRYWLEGGSLLGAVRTGDIIPWDYDVDIGIYKEDIVKCEWLKNSLQQSIVDTQGFVWEKAREGDFIRVQFSQSNHLHVDIFPFYSKNGTMTKSTWFQDHPQDMEFPEHFLKPLYKIKFVGVSATVPNNYRKFLELKFGKGAIENPEYPDPKLLQFHKKRKY